MNKSPLIEMAEVRGLLHYDPVTGRFTWLTRVRSDIPAGSEAGSFCDQGYRVILIGGKAYRAHRLAWLLTHGEWPRGDVYHVNRDRSDNRIANLRLSDNRTHLRKSLADRFRAKHDIRGDADCWNWTGCRSNRRYGSMRVNGRMVAASRVSWELHHGPIPAGLCVCHHCDNGFCGNPAHLFLGTIGDNNLDKQEKGRARTRWQPGEACYAAKLSDLDATAIRNDRRTQKEIAAAYGVSRATIWSIKSGKTWRHLLGALPPARAHYTAYEAACKEEPK